MIMVMMNYLFLVLLLLPSAVFFTVITASPPDSKILIHIPFHVHDPNGFDHITADFGFGSIMNDFQSISSYVYYIDEVLCYPSTNHSVGYPTLAPGTSWISPFILLINGGGACSHVTKVRNAQMIGAAAVVLAQPKCSCSDANCTVLYPPPANAPPPTCEDDDYLATTLINDGSAEDITIPSYYLMKPISETLKSTLRSNQTVLMELQWGIPDAFMEDNDKTKVNVEIEFWSSAYDPHTRVETYTDLRTITNAFSENDHITFVPQFFIQDGTRLHCVGVSQDDSPCDHLCTNNGKYCTNHGTDLSGHAILNETLRRTCIYEHSSNSGNKKHDMYWEYVLYHKKECSKYSSTYADDKCIRDAMKHANIDIKSIASCMDNSGGLDRESNTNFDSALTSQKRKGIITIPSLMFNKHILHRTSAYLLFEVICNEYWMSNVRNVPDICLKCSSCANTVGCVENHGKCIDFNNHDRYIMPHDDHQNHSSSNNKKEKKKSYFWSRLGWMIFFGAVFGGAYYYYDTHLKDARRSGSRPLMNDYLHLNVDG